MDAAMDASWGKEFISESGERFTRTGLTERNASSSVRVLLNSVWRVKSAEVLEGASILECTVKGGGLAGELTVARIVCLFPGSSRLDDDTGTVSPCVLEVSL
jgi:hypothetical protein